MQEQEKRFPYWFKPLSGFPTAYELPDINNWD